LGVIEIKAMTEQGYDLEFSTAVTAASAVIGPIIPPSTCMIIYGITASVAIDKLFIGGILPGVMIGIVEMMLVLYYAKKRNYPKSGRFSLVNAARNFFRTFPALLTPLIIIGGILGGVFTATEAGAIAAVYSLFISLVIYKEISFRDLPKVFYEAIFTTATVLFIVATASIFGWVLTYTQMPRNTAALLVSITENKYLLLILFSIMYVILGMLMEAAAIIIMTVPIVVPIFTAIGIDLVHFGVVLAILMSLGTITPPVGTAMFVICKMTNQSIEKFTKFMMPWFGVILLVVLILIFFPQAVLFLPSIM
jgi:tripartite ATP-independent transporter DctM subunit